ncbi:DUF4936 family protein [Thiobacillus sedimenti]|uniref:DUF4936 family protein n=1 Tax=Thiobacillus sedimenti TaxID=3110231 RepID=A0ABZ1CGX9_9PROT|nr:DUF4936 family protein [Thiobacillus sp. SCUT-2]WRS38623.1 DUF4936 family protein [Thiobacillus sp. SCUT-2]
MLHAYVYYRVDPAQAARLAPRVDAVLQAMAALCGRPPQRLTRCDDPDTWMEVYGDIADFAAFLAALEAAVAASGCVPLIHGERHLECFRPA